MYILFSVDTSSKDIQEKHVVDQDTKGGWSQPRLRGVVIMAGWQQPMHTWTIIEVKLWCHMIEDLAHAERLMQWILDIIFGVQAYRNDINQSHIK